MTAPTIADRAGLLGHCVCPVCKSTDAEVVQGKRMPHIVCEDCGTLIQTRTRRGGKLIAAMVQQHRVDPPPEPPKPAPAPPAPPPPVKRKTSAVSFLGIEE